jgi:putative DNA primase/helicase
MTWLWGNASQITPDDPAGMYLISRGLKRLPLPDAARYYHEVQDQQNYREYHPALLTRFVGPLRERSVLHATYLTATGAKAEMEKPKQFFKNCQIPKGGAVRLFPAAETMGVCEGLETSLAQHQRTGLPIWATLSAGAVLSFVPPPECKTLVVMGDRDPSWTGQMVAYSLALRLTRENKMKCIVTFPRPEGGADIVDEGRSKDFNDVLRDEMRRARRG